MASWDSFQYRKFTFSYGPLLLHRNKGLFSFLPLLLPSRPNYNSQSCRQRRRPSKPKKSRPHRLHLSAQPSLPPSLVPSNPSSHSHPILVPPEYHLGRSACIHHRHNLSRKMGQKVQMMIRPRIHTPGKFHEHRHRETLGLRADPRQQDRRVRITQDFTPQVDVYRPP